MQSVRASSGAEAGLLITSWAVAAVAVWFWQANGPKESSTVEVVYMEAGD